MTKWFVVWKSKERNRPLGTSPYHWLCFTHEDRARRCFETKKPLASWACLSYGLGDVFDIHGITPTSHTDGPIPRREPR